MVKKGDYIYILNMDDESNYSNLTGYVQSIDSLNQIHGTWGGCALIPEVDTFIVIPGEWFKYFKYLEALRLSGITNMFGAVPYIQNEFNLSKIVSSEILLYFMKYYEVIKKWIENERR